ncbi:hypothetical protein VCR31J2_90185 [Vibrio coralliirubri]|uniref:Uncharacterized protein n=1 Tax=Vibrio coralliirubri TaxID=1516159 RepID=A0AA86XRM8_9VIBR|nr:hypothetical protein VCR31J2_90185 [Vibrio coralliirubri]
MTYLTVRVKINVAVIPLILKDRFKLVDNINAQSILTRKVCSNLKFYL